ncbi:MAG: Mrp/NBP35 family ATP-binding protein [Anaerolineae bacterium]|nr:Mrp/NBP35 family ATP-binding protein [Anaerolineae bacterium]
MIDQAYVLEALKAVQDPELGKSIVDLGMVHDVAVEGGVVRFTLALTTLACPLRERMMDDARQVLLGHAGIEDVQITLREMTPQEKERIWPKQQAQAQPGGTAAHLNQVDRVIAVMSGKGGVGKSSVAAMLATSLQRQGKQVGVLDADITGPSIPKMFGLHGAPPMGPVGILPAETETGIRVMSINLLLPSEDEAVIWRGPLISGAIRQFWGDVLWGKLDALVVDLPPGTSDASLTVMQSIPLNGILLVTSPQDLAGMVVRKAARMAGHLNVPIVGLVENMSAVICPKCGERIEVFGPSQAAGVAMQLGAPLLAQIPLDPELALRCDAGEVEQYRSVLFDTLAADVARRLPAQRSVPIFT